MHKKIPILILFSLFTLSVLSQESDRVNLSHFLPDGFEINSLSFSTDGMTGFFTASNDWEKQLPFLVSVIDSDTTVSRIHELDTIYNGTISPSGNQIIYCTKGVTSPIIFLTKRKGNRWSTPINLSKQSGINGGYFHWYSESELYFYVPEGKGDLVSGYLKNDKLVNIRKLNELNTEHTEFSPFVGPEKSYIIFTKYVEGNKEQQGLMVSKNIGSKHNPAWSSPDLIEGIPYGWGAFVFNHYLFFTDGAHILVRKMADHNLN